MDDDPAAVPTLRIAKSENLEIEGLTVSAEREAGSTASLLDERRTSSAVVEAVGAQEIARRPDSDAAEVAQRMTGVTVTDGRGSPRDGIYRNYDDEQMRDVLRRMLELEGFQVSPARDGTRPRRRPTRRSAPSLSRGRLPLPHLGDWMQPGHPSSQAQSASNSSARRTRRSVTGP